MPNPMLARLLACVAIITLAGCGGSPAANTSSSPTLSPSATSASPTPTPTETTPARLTVATKKFCNDTIKHSSQGLDAINKLVDHPDGKGLTADDFSRPRTLLDIDDTIAPTHLQKYLKTQIKVLDAIIDVFNGKGNTDIETGKYRDASLDFLTACSQEVINQAPYDPKPKDFAVGVKILRRQCFGDAGCNVTYRIKPSYVGLHDLPDVGVTEVTYEVIGDESGPITNTFTIDSDGTAHFDREELASTPPGTKLKAKVLDASYDENG